MTYSISSRPEQDGREEFLKRGALWYVYDYKNSELLGIFRNAQDASLFVHARRLKEGTA